MTVQIAVDKDHPDQIAYELHVPVGDEVASPGQQREQLTSDKPFEVDITDSFWSQSSAVAAGAADPRVRCRTRTRTARRPSNRSSASWAWPAVIALIVAVIASRPHRRPTVQPDPAPDRRCARAVGGPSRDARSPAIELARDGRADDRLQLDGRARPGVDRVHPPRPRSEPRLPGRRLARAQDADRRAAHVQRAAQRGPGHGRGDASGSSWSSRASRSTVSTGWPPTCSSCPSSSRAWCCSTCARTTCAPSSRARSQQAQPAADRKGVGARRRPARRADPPARTIRSAWARCWATCSAMPSSSRHAAARFA